MKDQIINILKNARKRVARGWIQGQGQTPNGSHVCSAQAIALQIMEDEQVTRSSHYDTASKLLLAAAYEQTGQVWGSVPDWNDTTGRTQQEVLDTFDHAVKLAERDLV